MNKEWILLSEKLPEGDDWVLIFHPGLHTDTEFPGLSVSASNPYYVRINAIKNGYTHWAKIPYPLPVPIKTDEYCQDCFTCKHFFKWQDGCRLEYTTETLDDHNCIYYEKRNIEE